MNLRKIEPTIAHTASQKAILASLDYPEVAANALGERFGISGHMVMIAHRVREHCSDDVIQKIMTDKKLTVSKIYRTEVVNGTTYNKRRGLIED